MSVRLFNRPDVHKRFIELRVRSAWLRAGVHTDTSGAWLVSGYGHWPRQRYFAVNWQRRDCGHRHLAMRRSCYMDLP